MAYDRLERPLYAGIIGKAGANEQKHWRLYAKHEVWPGPTEALEPVRRHSFASWNGSSKLAGSVLRVQCTFVYQYLHSILRDPSREQLLIGHNDEHSIGYEVGFLVITEHWDFAFSKPLDKPDKFCNSFIKNDLQERYHQNFIGLDWIPMWDVLGIKLAPALTFTPELGPTLPQVCLFSGVCPNSVPLGKAEVPTGISPEEIALKKEYLGTIQRLLALNADAAGSAVSPMQIPVQVKGDTTQNTPLIVPEEQGSVVNAAVKPVGENAKPDSVKVKNEIKNTPKLDVPVVV
ncbi:hypothetical protein K493DRAFT_370533 [Basidiobolus meristosporus CBS 931.73]|uniref:Uncharacterized protein n=1 Tax=Basidiobolus meristosporus CBS 931.73 TaxID=1314790 RepID=A0A1Y1YGA9_9FUNG|nr:hypothetical protein K493DRAFT_370533 [Basidiobolus meristosporus CBS 931.73]|eukprot:ORX96786.1 hypothetical protein K493DRAFT_370533 [Basidiobolus meristosporus CBS 931.73]